MAQIPDATRLAEEASEGDQRAVGELLDMVYEELRAIASRSMSRERAGHTLQPTALVHEAFLKLIDQTRVNWQGRTHFKAVAAQAMHRILVDHGRASKREKRGGGWHRVSLNDAFRLSATSVLDGVALHDALDKMRALDPRQTQIVKLRLFGGLTSDEIARLLDVSARTVERDWKMGQAWLRRELSRGDGT